MSDRLIYLRENQRRVLRGLSYDSANVRYEMDMEEGETLKVQVNCTGILASGETITAATVENEGVTCTVSLSSPTATLTLSALTGYGTGNTTLTLTKSGGEVLKLRLRARARRNYRYFDYYSAVPT